MHAAVVKLDALTNAVGAATEHHDFLVVGRCGFALGALGLVGRIHIGGVRAKFGCASVHPLVDRAHGQGDTLVAHGGVGGFELARQTAVRKAFLLERAQRGRVDGVQRRAGGGLRQTFNFQLDLDDLLDLHQKPGVDLGQRKHLVHAHAQGKGITHVPDALGAGFAQLFFQHFAVLGFLVHAVHAHFQAAQSFLEGFLESAAHGHHFAHRLHLGRQAAVGGRELFKRKTRDFGDHVVNAGLKTGRRGAAGDVVTQLVQRKTDRQLGGDFGNRKTRGLGRQRAGARHARVHLNDHHAAIVRVDRKLHVGAARVNANFAQHSQAGVTQNLVFLVGQRLRWRHRNGVAGVHAHGVQVFNRADDDAVVRLVAHHFHLVLFPTQKRLFNQQLIGGRGFQAALANSLKLFRVVSNTAASAAQGEAGADDGGET